MAKFLNVIFSLFLFMCSSCHATQQKEVLHFSISAEYPPFEYRDNSGQFQGFDIDLAKMLASELGMEPEFHDMQFSTIFPALSSGMVDASISTITITKDREKIFDFSNPYYRENMSMVFLKANPIDPKQGLNGKRIAAQLGSTMEIWLREHCTNDTSIIAVDTNPQAIEDLKSKRIDGVLMDSVQAAAFAGNNPELTYTFTANSSLGYGIAFRKGSPLKKKINDALSILEKKGEIEKLRKRYIEK